MPDQPFRTPENQDDLINSLLSKSVKTPVLGVLLALSVVLITAGLVLLINQNHEIAEKNRQIEKMRQKLEFQSGRLSTLVQAGEAGNPVAAREAKIQAEQIQAQLLANDTPSAISPLPDALSPGQNVTVASGPSFGWDVDVFWCESTDSAGDQAAARAAALVLAQAAAARKPIGPGVVLGKIRLRSWPEKFREGTITGNSVISDSGMGEDATRNIIADTLNAKTSFGFARKTSVGKETRFYISVFACRGWRQGSADTDAEAHATAD